MNLSLRGVEHVFAGPPPVDVLDGVTFEIPAGQFVALVGPSGCGKSTLLRLAAGLLPLQQGEIWLDGAPPQKAQAERRIAWMGQSPALLPWLNLRANVALAHRVGSGLRPARLAPDEALALVGLGDRADSHPFMLSGGMQQRLALARTLSLDARLWLMDEPFAALDEMTRERLALDLADLWQPLRPTVLWVTHNIYEALRLADRVLVFSRRPARVTADLLVPLPRPRREADPAFQALLAKLRAGLTDALERVS